MRSRILAAAFAMIALVPLPAPAAPEPFTLDVARKLVGVSNARVSPDGRSIAFIVSKPDFEKDKNESELWLADAASGQSRALTFERRSVSSPRWSPDGGTIAFLAPDEKEKAQVWLLPLAGGESRRLTKAPMGVDQFSWRPDGRAIAFATADTLVTKKGEARHLATFTVEDEDVFLRREVTPNHLWVQELAGEARRITSGTWSLEFSLPPGSPPSALAWSPDGQRIAFARVPAPQSGRLDSTSLAVVDIASGTVRDLTGVARFENHPEWSPDGRTISYWAPREGRGDINWVQEVHVVPATGGKGRSVTHALDRMAFHGQWFPDSKRLLVAANDRTSTGVWIQPVDGAAQRLALGDLVVNGAFSYDIDLGKTGRIAFTATTPSRPSELYVMDTPTAKPRRLTNLNAWADSVRWARLERMTWPTHDGMEADGVVTWPADFDATKPHPLVLLIHGGPTSASKVNFSSLAQLMASEGWVVFQPNYRGSDNLGNRFMAAIQGDWGAGPGRDVMAGVAAVRAKPGVDPKRTAVTGWSYGGYMTAWLLGNYPDEWTCAMAGAPVTSWEDQYNLSDGNVSTRYVLGGSPWTGDRQRIAREQSPITYATKIKAPTLVMSHVEDFRVPPTQALSLYRAMKDNGVETEYIAFQGRTHNPSDPVNQRERMRLWVDWVKRHLPETGKVTQVP
jgi:dipeptidyl aminopeptidase/acylaminoacyl peptidase